MYGLHQTYLNYSRDIVWLCLVHISFFLRQVALGAPSFLNLQHSPSTKEDAMVTHTPGDSERLRKETPINTDKYNCWNVGINLYLSQ